MNFRNPAPATKKRFHVSIRLRKFLCFLDIARNAGKIPEVFAYKRARLIPPHACCLRKRGSTHAIKNPEIQGLCRAPMRRSYLFKRNVIDLGCGRGVNISARAKRLDHFLIISHVRRNAKLDLGIVKRHKNISGRRNKRFANFFSVVRHNGDILEIRVL